MNVRSMLSRWPVRGAGAYLALLVLLAALAPIVAHDAPRALIHHEPGRPDPFARLLPPGRPELRVLPLAGSGAAERLGLTELERVGASAYIAADITPYNFWRPDAELHLPLDFVVITASLERFPVRLADITDPVAVAEQITVETNHLVRASIGTTPFRYEFIDTTVPAEAHLLGTDRHGADVAANLVHGARTVITVALVAAVIAFMLGVTVGSLMGMFGGVVDFVGLRLIEVFSAVPRLLVLLIVASTLSPAYGRHMPAVLMIVIGMMTWMVPARLVRGEMLRVREEEFVLAARAVGARPWREIVKHMLPHAVVPVLVEAAFYMSSAVLLERI